MAAVACAAIVTVRQRIDYWTLLGGVSLGLAVGTKVNAVVVLGFFGVVLLSHWHQLKQAPWWLVGWLGALCIGLALANPVLLIDPRVVWHHIVETNVGAAANPWIQLQTILSNDVWSWDETYIGGFFQVVFNPICLLLLIVWLWLTRVPRVYLLAASLMWLITVGLFMNKTVFYGWYWFPLIAVLPFVIVTAKTVERRWLLLGLVVLLVSAVTAVPIIVHNYQNKLDHAHIIMEQSNTQACLTQVVPAQPAYAQIVNYPDLDYSLDFTFLSDADTTFDFWQSRAWILGTGLYDGRTLVVVGDRLKQHQPFVELEPYLRREILPLYPTATELTVLPKCDALNLYIIDLVPAEDQTLQS